MKNGFNLNLKDNILDVSNKKSTNEKEVSSQNDAIDTKEIVPIKVAKDFFKSTRRDK